MDEAVLLRLLAYAGASAGPVYGKKGKRFIQQRLSAYNQAALHSAWVVLVDLDRDAECAPPLRASWLPSPAPLMCFRVAVRAVESWLIGDRERLSRFLGVAISRIPRNPEAIADPKRAMIDLAARSRRAEIREDMVPRARSGRRQGPAYESQLVEFVSDSEVGWRPDVAASDCESLNRCLHALVRLCRQMEGS